MTACALADDLDHAAGRIADLSRADLQAMLRRAALRLRNTEQFLIDPEWEDALQCVAAELDLGRNDLIRMMVKEWLEANAFLPVPVLEEGVELEARR
ncbi:hypothetical protein [Pseudaminobacter sp. NGMCC 1.201702]|uniref:hypothetical protein n=1 Tax=Pseudaminobacter sp. NGMCC 1.201702 TaxID=3391825 RepID=UPI0039EE023C